MSIYFSLINVDTLVGEIYNTDHTLCCFEKVNTPQTPENMLAG